MMFNYVFVTFPCDILGQVWYLMVSIPDFCHLFYFVLCMQQWSKHTIVLLHMTRVLKLTSANIELSYNVWLVNRISYQWTLEVLSYGH